MKRVVSNAANNYLEQFCSVWNVRPVRLGHTHSRIHVLCHMESMANILTDLWNLDVTYAPSYCLPFESSYLKFLQCIDVQWLQLTTGVLAGNECSHANWYLIVEYMCLLTCVWHSGGIILLQVVELFILLCQQFSFSAAIGGWCTKVNSIPIISWKIFRFGHYILTLHNTFWHSTRSVFRVHKTMWPNTGCCVRQTTLKYIIQTYPSV